VQATADSLAYNLVFAYSLPVAWWIVSSLIACVLIVQGIRAKLGQFSVPAIVISLFMLSLIGMLISRRTTEHRLVQSMYQAKTLPMVEGRVEGFVPGGLNGHTAESFSVSGVGFSYSVPIFDGGFHQIQALGGPIREGLRVRIYYLPASRENKIVRIEVAE
jgi:hypothetical protein